MSFTRFFFQLCPQCVRDCKQGDVATRREKINKSLIDGLEPVAGEELFIIDSELDGFGFRLMPTGAGSYFIRYVNNDGPRRRFSRMKVAGNHAPPEEARTGGTALVPSDGG